MTVGQQQVAARTVDDVAQIVAFLPGGELALQPLRGPLAPLDGNQTLAPKKSPKRSINSRREAS